MGEDLTRRTRGSACSPSSAGSRGARVNYFVQSKGILVELRAKFSEETLDTCIAQFGPAEESQELEKQDGWVKRKNKHFSCRRCYFKKKSFPSISEWELEARKWLSPLHYHEAPSTGANNHDFIDFVTFKKKLIVTESMQQHKKPAGNALNRSLARWMMMRAPSGGGCAVTWAASGNRSESTLRDRQPTVTPQKQQEFVVKVKVPETVTARRMQNVCSAFDPSPERAESSSGAVPRSHWVI